MFWSIKYKINSSNIKYQLWSGNLSQNESDTILLSGIAIGGNSHIIEATAILPNNNPDIDSLNNSDIKLFQTNSGTNININLITDNYANETSWILLDNNNNIIDSESSLLNNFHYIYNYCLEDNCYKFIINDSEGDGFCCNYGNGNISINKELNNQEIANLSIFTYSDTIYFCVSSLSVTNPQIKNQIIFPNPSIGRINIKSNDFKKDIPIIANIFDIKGRKVFSGSSINYSFDISRLQNGIYILELEQENIIIRNKIIINKT